MKAIAVTLITLFCLGLAVCPELAMYWSWNLIQPESELTRILLIIAFWFGGAGFCVGFGALCFYLWLIMVASL